MVLRRVGARTNRIVMGSIIVSIVLAFLVPSATARAAAVIPIMMGVVLAFGVDRKSRFAGMMMITTVQAVSIWNVGIKTAAAQNMIAIGFIQSTLHQDVTWLNWLIAAAPFSILMSVGLYYIMMFMMPPEANEMPGGQAAVDKALAELRPMTAKEKRLLAVSLILLCFWATEGILHPFDSSTTTTVAVALLFLHAQDADSRCFHLLDDGNDVQFVVSFGFILPVNSPQGMLAYGTETFFVRDFVRTGIAITALAYVLTLIFGATYWHWFGYV